MHLRTDTSAQAHFAAVPTISKPRNSFSVAETHKTTMQFDKLFPMYNQIMYPGDTLAITQNIMARLQTQIRTLFDDLYIDAHAWFVPMRLIQTNWARYQFNAQPSGPTQDNSALTSPKIDLATLGAGGFPQKSLYDYFGYPTKIDASGNTEHINNYYGRAYNLIWNDNYRDTSLQNAAVVDLDDGPDLQSDYVLLSRGKRHDKFTSALTAQQKGPASVVPLGTRAPVYGIGKTTQSYASGDVNVYETGKSTFTTYSKHRIIDPATTDNWVRVQEDPTNAGYPNIWTDLSVATAATVNQLRQSVAVQQLLEADARGGTRDVESIQHRWGVTVPDFRLQRPEYLGGSTFSFDGHVVPQTSATVGGGTPQATLTQFSQSLSQFSVSHSFVEHGVFMILISARSNITYQQGLSRELSYRTRYDWYQPEFANLGEVAVKNKEIMFQGGNGVADNQTFGFQEYAYELRYRDNRVSGEMRSNYTTPLDSYHMADLYVTLPTLGPAWIQSNTPISRNIAVSAATADPIQINSLVTGRIARTLPMYSVPGLMRL